MSADVAAAQLRFVRLRAQWLTSDDAAATPVEIVRHLTGIQAQIPSAAVLAVRVRTVHVRAEDVNRDVAPGGPLVRTWLMRGTLHLAATEDVDWLLAVLAPAVLRASRRRHTELGLDSAALTRSADVLTRLLEDGQVTRAELFAGLAGHGIDPSGQRGIHLIRHAALHGLLSCGPDRGREQTWVIREPSTVAFDRVQALVELA
ncbi:MAG TPA: crosslink repair DNA glycosylase YcaQ family protein, partial [Jiangellaceae bacterium]